MARNLITSKQVKLLHDVVHSHNENGAIFAKAGDVVTFPLFEANELIYANWAVAYTKGGK